MSLFSEFARMQRDMDRMWRHFDQEFGVLSNDTLWAPQSNWMDVDRPLLTHTNEQQQQLTDGLGKKETPEEKRIEVGKEQPRQQQLQTVDNHQPSQQQQLAQRSNWLSPFGGLGVGGALSLGPRVDIQEQADKYLVTADLPGIAKENLKVDLDTDRNVLTLSGHTEHASEEKDPQGGRWVRRERSSGSFTRSLRLPADIKTDQLKAKLDNGVLRVELPRLPQVADPKLKDNKQPIKID